VNGRLPWRLALWVLLAHAAFAPLAHAAPASPYSVVVDDASSARFDAAAEWGTSAWNGERYGRGYRVARPQARLDEALFRVPVPRSGRYEVFAWWPSDRGYNASTPYRIVTSEGIRVVRVDQRSNGGRWVRLGAFPLRAGDDWIVGVSARTPGPGYVVADAVRVVGGPAAAGDARPVLELGARGGAVRELQTRLTALRYLRAGSADGVFGMRTWHAVVAFQGWRRLPRDGVVGPATQAALRVARRPSPWGGLRRGLELDLGRQVLLLVSGGATVRAIHVSTAAPGYHTPVGSFRVYRRERFSWSYPYGVWLPHALYFSEGHALHGYGSVPSFPASHGCVRVPLDEAPAVYAFAPLGTPVRVR
jgi:putative peptidoglycan binding protein/L,D-transpeptidase-like protein